MPPTETCLAKQAKRLTKLPFAPQDEEGLKALLDEFKRVLRPRCFSDAHCAAVVDYLIDHSQRCPPPAELIDAVQTIEDPGAPKAPTGCEDCGGTGFVSYQKFSRKHGYVVDYSDFCRCPLGSWKRDMERQRKAEAAAKAAR